MFKCKKTNVIYWFLKEIFFIDVLKWDISDHRKRHIFEFFDMFFSILTFILFFGSLAIAICSLIVGDKIWIYCIFTFLLGFITRSISKAFNIRFIYSVWPWENKV